MQGGKVHGLVGRRGRSGLTFPAMRPFLVIAFLLLNTIATRAQVQMNEAAAKEAVYRIVRHSGLLPNFVVREDATVPNAVAYIKGHDRVIAYNAAFVSSILDSTRTSWAAVSILAHEIAHHLLGHTLDPEAVHPGDELACDRYSGFILQRMGVSRDDALASMEVACDVHGTRRHPPRHARLAAIAQGWEESDHLAHGVEQEPFVIERPFRFVVHLAGDANTYYVDGEGCLVWFDDHARPIQFGSCDAIVDGEFAYELEWQEQLFMVDGRSTIWRRTAHGIPMQVGRMEMYDRPADR